MNRVYLALGSNLGDRKGNLEAAGWEIGRQAGPIITHSGIYETEPWGNKNQHPFYNQVLEINTDLTPTRLLNTLLLIEAKLGRTRIEKWSPRTLDIDILFYGNEIICQNDLILPHPEIQNRRFVLEPLNEIAGNFIHPVIGCSITRLLAACTDDSAVRKIT